MLRTSVMICQFWMNCDTVLFTRVKASVICIMGCQALWAENVR